MTNFTMFKGETLIINLNITNSDGSPKNLNGAKIYVTVKNQVEDTDNIAVWQGSTGSLGGVVVINALIGQATATMPPTATYQLPGSQPVILDWDAKVIDAAGINSVADSGTITVNPAVTRAIS